MSCCCDMEALLVKLGARFLVFGAVFAFAARKNPKITVKPRYALPLVALVFALLNTGLYFLLKPVLNIATLGMASLVVPFVLNRVHVNVCVLNDDRISVRTSTHAHVPVPVDCST